MTVDIVQQQISDGLVAGTVLAAPLLLAASAIGFLFALFQAITQIQDQTLPQVVKIFVIGIMLFTLGGVLAQPLLDLADRSFLAGGR